MYLGRLRLGRMPTGAQGAAVTRRTAYLLGVLTAPLLALAAVIAAADLWALTRWIGARL